MSSSEGDNEANTASSAVSSAHEDSKGSTIRRRKKGNDGHEQDEANSDNVPPIVDAIAPKQSTSGRDQHKVKDDTELEADDDEGEQAEDDERDDKEEEGNEEDEESEVEDAADGEEDEEEEMDDETRERLIKEKEEKIQRLLELQKWLEESAQRTTDSSEDDDAPFSSAAADVFAGDRKDEDDMPFILVSFAGFVLFAIFALIVCFFGVDKSYVMAGGMVSFLVLIIATSFGDSEKDELPLFHVFLIAGCFGVMLGGMVGGLGIIEALPYTS
eukprot:gb/GECG01009562.1/.p1 GENE.gb/GECG01009562.1/~~gb/GECG01009562.1/.p1  ORF type:complete len:272 (+),score=77.58 gb/GECG01009562.1/:1-816(+)